MLKKILLGALLLFCSTFPAWSANFVEIKRDTDWLIYVDIDSVEMREQANDKYLVAWEKWIPRGDNKQQATKRLKQPVDYFMYFKAYNMKRKQAQALSIYVYDNNGQAIDSFSNDFRASNYREIIPNTYGDLVYECVKFLYKEK